MKPRTRRKPDEIGWALEVALKSNARRSQWLKIRKNKITGSKIADIMGEGYHDIFDRYRIERGELDPGPGGLNMIRGTLMEPEILAAAESDPMRPGAFEVLETPAFLTRADLPGFGCSPDFLAVSASPGFCDRWKAHPVKIYGEIKDRDGTQRYLYRGGGCRASEVYQIRLGMMISGADLGLLCVRLGVEEQLTYRIIERDETVEREMAEAGGRFLQAVADGDLGSLVDLAESGEVRKAITFERYAESRPEKIESEDPELVAMCEDVESMKAERAELSERIKMSEALIAEAMGEAERLILPGFSVSLPAKRKGRRTFSAKLLKSALPHLDLEPYYNTSSSSGRGSMRITRITDEI